MNGIGLVYLEQCTINGVIESDTSPVTIVKPSTLFTPLRGDDSRNGKRLFSKSKK
jgi:hypothetical protein